MPGGPGLPSPRASDLGHEVGSAPSDSAPGAESLHERACALLASIFPVILLAMLTRLVTLPNRTFFLLGPRGTGKTTWLRSALKDARWYDLLLDRELVRLMRDPGSFRAEVMALPAGSWVVVDEVQRLPAILDDVQALLTEVPDRYRFALTGSSARRIRREGANLLPGRAINRRFFPLTLSELGHAPTDDLVRFGTLPAVCTAEDDTTRIELLEAYVANYVAQEIRIEATVRSLDAFTRFLDVAALANGQVTNVAGIARDAAVARPTVQGYFEVLVDTLLGVWLPAWRPRARVKEVGHSKFYFFDTGLVRALSGRLREPLEPVERGYLLETYVLHELRAHIDRASLGGELSYWRTPHGMEVDFVWTRGTRSVAIEVKASARWRSEFDAGLTALSAAGHVERAFGVYLGDVAQRRGPIDVLPLREFLARLCRGEVLA